MSIRITDVNIVTPYNCEDIRGLTNWNSVKNTNNICNNLRQSVLVGETVKIEISLIEDNWQNIMENFNTWGDIKIKLNNWMDVSKY